MQEGITVDCCAPAIRPLPPGKQEDFVKTLSTWLCRQCLRQSEIPYKATMGG